MIDRQKRKLVTEFIETPTFTRMVTPLLSDDEYRKMQGDLVEYPERGDLVVSQVEKG